MDIRWVIEGHFLQAIRLLLVILLIITLFVWLARSVQHQPREAEEGTDAIGHMKYTEDHFIGLD